jgi:hypothetical protein
MIPAMIVSLRHFLGWLVSVFRSRESVGVCDMPQRLMHGTKFPALCRLGMAGRFGGEHGDQKQFAIWSGRSGSRDVIANGRSEAATTTGG